MKSKPHNESRPICFWTWFTEIAQSLAYNLDNPHLLEELDRRVSELHPSISWEVGPGRKASSQLVISPNLDRDLLPITRRIISYAPSMANWEIYAARQSKQWNYILKIEDESGMELCFDVSSWTYVLLKYPQGDYEVVIKSNKPLPSSKDVCWQISAIILESEMGEELLLEKIGTFTLVEALDAKWLAREKPIKDLRRAFGL